MFKITSDAKLEAFTDEQFSGWWAIRDVVSQREVGFFEEDAKLFAAAPDLLESLRDMVDAMESYGYSHSPEIITARAAIARATK